MCDFDALVSPKVWEIPGLHSPFWSTEFHFQTENKVPLMLNCASTLRTRAKEVKVRRFVLFVILVGEAMGRGYGESSASRAAGAALALAVATPNPIKVAIAAGTATCVWRNVRLFNPITQHQMLLNYLENRSSIATKVAISAASAAATAAAWQWARNYNYRYNSPGHALATAVSAFGLGGDVRAPLPQLPPELWLHILSFLRISDLHVSSSGASTKKSRTRTASTPRLLQTSNPISVMQVGLETAGVCAACSVGILAIILPLIKVAEIRSHIART